MRRYIYLKPSLTAQYERKVWGYKGDVYRAVKREDLLSDTALPYDFLDDTEEIEVKGHTDYNEYGLGEEAYNDAIDLFVTLLDATKEDIEAYWSWLILQTGLGSKWAYRYREWLKAKTLQLNPKWRVWFSDFIRSIKSKPDAREVINEAIMETIENMNLQRRFHIIGHSPWGEAFIVHNAGAVLFLKKGRERGEGGAQGGRGYAYYYSISSVINASYVGGITYGRNSRWYYGGLSCKESYRCSNVLQVSLSSW